MANSTSPITVERMLPYIEPLTRGEEAIWRVPPNRSIWFAKRVREALYAARANAERFPELAAASYRVEVVSSREVRATPKIDPAIERISQPTALPHAAPRRALVETAHGGGPSEIASLWDHQGRSAGKLHLPNALLSRAQLLELYEWASTHEVLLFVDGPAITLLDRRTNEEAAEFAFSPEDLPPEILE